jgi:hypothetical protein
MLFMPNQIFNRSDYDFTARTLGSRVLAYDSRDDRWVQTTMGAVKDYTFYTRFFFVDDLEADVPVEEEVEPTAADRAREGVNEMISWINMWAVKMPAVDAKLNEFRDQIFEAIDELEEEMDG